MNSLTQTSFYYARSEGFHQNINPALQQVPLNASSEPCNTEVEQLRSELGRLNARVVAIGQEHSFLHKPFPHPLPISKGNAQLSKEVDSDSSFPVPTGERQESDPSTRTSAGLSAQTAAKGLPKPPQFKLNPRARLAKIRQPVPTEIFVHDPTECKFISKSLLEKGYWEPGLQQEILKSLRASRVPAGKLPFFLDVGANIGSFSMVVAAAGYNVVSFEPMSYNMELLNASVVRQGFQQRITLFQTALSIKSSETPVCIAAVGNGPVNRGNGQVSLLSAGNACKPGTEEVPVHTVDELLQLRTTSSEVCVRALKVDIEGFEVFALRGAAGIFGGHCPPCVVAMEFNQEYSRRAAQQLGFAPGLDGLEIFRFLSDENGYRCESVRAGKAARTRVFSPWHGAPGGDYLCFSSHPSCA